MTPIRHTFRHTTPETSTLAGRVFLADEVFGDRLRPRKRTKTGPMRSGAVNRSRKRTAHISARFSGCAVSQDARAVR